MIGYYDKDDSGSIEFNEFIDMLKEPVNGDADLKSLAKVKNFL